MTRPRLGPATLSSPDAAESVTVPLDHPIEVDGTTVSELTLRRPSAYSLIRAELQTGLYAKDAALVASCAGVPFEAVGRLDAADYRRASDAGVATFFFWQCLTADNNAAAFLALCEPEHFAHG